MRHQSSWYSIVQPSSSRARVPRLFFTLLFRLFFFSREGVFVTVFTGQAFSTQFEEHHLTHGLVPGLSLGAAVGLLYGAYKGVQSESWPHYAPPK